MNGVLSDWGRLSRAERDAAYNNSAAVADSAAQLQRRADASAAFRAAHPPREIAYGPHERQRIDLFGTAPRLMVFIHGGYWQRGSRDVVSVLAEGPLAHRWSVACIGYRIAPEVTLPEIVADVTAALDRLAEFAPLVVAGHSAGGHLAALALAHPAVAEAIAIAGVFELGPIRDIELNDNLRLTDADVTAYSPLRLPLVPKPLHLAYGSAELPALVANSCDLFARRAASHQPGVLLPIAGADHFSVLDALQNPDGAICRLLLA